MALRHYALTDEERLTDGDAVFVRVRAGADLVAGQLVDIEDGVATPDAAGTYFAPKTVRAGDVFWARISDWLGSAHSGADQYGTAGDYGHAAGGARAVRERRHLVRLSDHICLSVGA